MTAPKSDPKPTAQTKPADEKSKDDLPQREPLTPELVEDEAIRGDFMLRWAAVLLAFLLACTSIFETETLVHVKSGQYTLDNLHPAMTDVFSATAEGRPWINLHWLFDAILALVYNFGELLGSGGVALSLFKALLAAFAFWVVAHTNRKDVPTWWGTICAVIALLACHRQFTARPEIVTLLGLALTVRWLHAWKDEGNPKTIKHIALVFLLWSNLDPRMFLGLAVLVFYALGETLGDWLGFPGLPDEKRRRKLWLAVGVCVAVTFVNPFLWEAILSPVSLYSKEYAAHQVYNSTLRGYEQIQFRSLMDGDIWKRDLLTLSVGAGLLMLVIAAITFALNFRRLDLGHVFVLLGFAAFSVLAVHELAAAAIVAAGLAALNAQEWYQHTFRQTYSVETSELVFSRGGRAATVLALFGIAYLSLSAVAVFDMRFKRQTRVGIHPDVISSIEGLERELEGAYDDRPFNFVLSQGDLLVWIGKKPFIDSRLKLYANGESDLVALHVQTRDLLVGLKSRRTKDVDPQQWRTTLNDYRITHVLARLDTRLVRSPANYDVFFYLMGSPEWQLFNVGPTSAVFFRRKLPDEPAADWVRPKAYAKFLREHRFDLREQAFRKSSEPPETRATWPKAASGFDRYLRRPQPRTPNAVEEATHYARMLELGNWNDERTLPFALAMAHLAIRKANAGLNDDAAPHHAKAYRALGLAYLRLRGLEEALVRVVAQRNAVSLSPVEAQQMRLTAQRGALTILQRRTRQAIAALGQALVLEPDDLRTLRLMASIYDNLTQQELALQFYQRAIDVAERRGLTEDKAYEANIDRRDFWEAQMEAHRTQIAKIRGDITRSEADRPKRVEFVRRLAQDHYVVTAIEVIEEDPGIVEQRPDAALLWVNLLQLAGRTEESFNELTRLNLERIELPREAQAQRRDIVIYSELSRGNYLKPISLWQRDAELNEAEWSRQIFDRIPFAMHDPLVAQRELAGLSGGQPGGGLWFTEQTGALQSALQPSSDQVLAITSLYLNVGLSELEIGKLADARKTFEKILEFAPGAPAATLAAFYLALLRDEPDAPLRKRRAISPRPPVVAPRPRRR